MQMRSNVVNVDAQFGEKLLVLGLQLNAVVFPRGALGVQIAVEAGERQVDNAVIDDLQVVDLALQFGDLLVLGLEHLLLLALLLCQATLGHLQVIARHHELRLQIVHLHVHVVLHGLVLVGEKGARRLVHALDLLDVLVGLVEFLLHLVVDHLGAATQVTTIGQIVLERLDLVRFDAKLVAIRHLALLFR